MTIARALMLGAAAAGLMASAAQAADLVVPPVEPTAATTPFTFDGFYAGVYAGAASAAGGWGTVGAMVGANFSVADAVLGGVELQGGGDWMTGGSSYDVEVLAHLGLVLSDNIMAYGGAGVGMTDPVGPATQESGWLAGGGVEVGATDNLGIRGEVMYGHAFTGSDDGVKGTIGLMWHVN